MSALISGTCARLLLLEKKLRQGGIPQAHAYEVASIGTFKCDLSMLRDELGAVIVYDASSKVYELRNKDWPGVLPHVIEEAERAQV